MYAPNLSGYRLLMLAERKRKARRRLFHLSAWVSGAFLGGAIIGAGWLPW